MPMMRVGKLRRERNQAWTASGVAATLAGPWAVLLLRSIVQPLGTIVRELGPESTAMRRSVERLAVDSIRHRPPKEESRELATEMRSNWRLRFRADRVS